MTTPSLQKIIVTLVAVILLVFFGYKMFVGSLVAENGFTVSPDGSAGGEILNLVSKLKSVSIDRNFFGDPLFVNLRDFTRSVSPELQGRINPFAPIGSDIGTGQESYSQGGR